MVQEQYVSFEVAKLLWEKGFNSDECTALYDGGDNNKFVRDGSIYDNGAEDYLEYMWGDEWSRFPYYLAPTQAMVMKWLREIHMLHIAILWDCGAYIGKNSFCYHIDRMDNYEDKGYNKIGFDSYEEACESAIKYSLEKLI